MVVLCVAGVLASAAERPCGFDGYRALRMGVPTVGSHADLAIWKVSPDYPQDLWRKGVGGRVQTEFLINRAGDVIKVCASGESTLAKAVEEALMHWRFQKDFGFTFAGKSSGGPEYAILRLSFNFDACSAHLRGHVGFPETLSSEDLLSRVTDKPALETPSSFRHAATVGVTVLVDETGRVQCAEPGPGHPLLIHCALQGLRQWRFRPLEREGRRVPFVGRVAVQYSPANGVRVSPAPR